MKEDRIVDSTLMHKNGFTAVLPFSKHASPIFEQRKLWLLVDLRIIKSSIAYDYTNNNHKVRNLSDAVQHLAGKSLSCTIDCSHVYHCLQRAEQRSIQMLAFNFASKAFAYKRLAQCLSRSVSAFSRFMREYLGPVVKVEHCVQYVNDIEIAANIARDLIWNIRAVSEWFREARLKLTVESQTSRFL